MLNQHHAYISLGDLERYTQMLQESRSLVLASGGDENEAEDTLRGGRAPKQRANWGGCREYYRRAAQMCPKNGKPYNQLAVLALYGENPLEAVYFYSRSLAVRQPILTARDGLIALYEKIRKKRKRAVLETKQACAAGAVAATAANSPAQAASADQNDSRWRWVRPEQLSKLRSAGAAKDDVLTSHRPVPAAAVRSKEVSPRERTKRFAAAFLDVHGVLFSKVSVDEMTRLESASLATLDDALTSKALSPQRLVQVLLVAIFEVHNAARTWSGDGATGPDAANSDAPDGTPEPPSLVYTISARLAFETGRLILDHCAESLSNLTAEEVESGRGYFLTCLPALGIFVDWMVSWPRIWSNDRSGDGAQARFWQSLCRCLNELSRKESELRIPEEFDIWETLFDLDSGAQHNADEDEADDDDDDENDDEMSLLLAGRRGGSDDDDDDYDDWSHSEEDGADSDDNSDSDGQHSKVEAEEDAGVEAAADGTSIESPAVATNVVPMIPPDIAQAAQEVGLEPWEDIEIRGYVYLEGATRWRENQCATGRGCRTRTASSADDSPAVSPTKPQIKLALRLARIIAVAGLPQATAFVQFRYDDDTDILDFTAVADDSVPVPGPRSPAGSDRVVDAAACGDDGERTLEPGADADADAPASSPDAGERDEELQSLQERRAQLETEMRSKDSDRADREVEVRRVIELRDAAAKTARTVTPKVLFPDTNCFLDTLGLLVRLVECGMFKVSIPMMVVNELYSLQKGSTPDGEHGHKKGLAETARAAVAFLEAEFGTAQSVVTALTGAGSVLKTIAFRSETDTRAEDASNDDLILQSCVQYVKKHGGIDTAADGQVTCTVALLTGDINMKIKSHAADIPVRTIQDFSRWAFQ